MRRSADGTVNI